MHKVISFLNNKLAFSLTNPGPIHAGFWNIRSAVNKAALLHDNIEVNKLDSLSLCESWIVEEDSDATKLDVAPPGYSVLHSHRKNATHQNRGGGLSFIYRSSMQVRPCSNIIIDSPSTFEFQLVELRSGQTKFFLCNIYRPPSSDKRKFYDELIPFLEVVVAKAGDRLVLSGDFNCPGDSSAPDPELTSILDSFDLTQHVNKPTRKTQPTRPPHHPKHLGRSVECSDPPTQLDVRPSAGHLSTGHRTEKTRRTDVFVSRHQENRHRSIPNKNAVFLTVHLAVRHNRGIYRSDGQCCL